MFSLIFALAIIFCLIRSFQKTFVFVIVCSIWLMHFQSGLSGGLTFYSIISLASFIVFLTKERNVFRNMLSFPLWLPFIATAFSFLCTNYIVGPPHTPRTISIFFPIMLNLYVSWVLIKRHPRQMTMHFIIISLIYGSFIAFYNMIELALQSNPLVELFVKSELYNTEGKILEAYRYGIKRVQSIFLMHTTNGCACTLLFVTLLYAYINTDMLKRYKNLTIVVLPLLFLSVLFTGARSCIIGMFVCSLCVLNKRYMTVRYTIPLLLLCFATWFLANDYTSEVYNSIVNSDKAHLGSSESMRQGQLDLSLYFMFQSPWLGNGIGYTWNYVHENYQNEILGAESLWFPIMIDRGLLGVMAMALYWLYLLAISFKHNRKILFFVLGILLMNSMSSLPCFEPMNTYIYLIILLALPSKMRTKEYLGKLKNIQFSGSRSFLSLS